ncbi:Zn-dependent peptidase ImmA (M78 family) [Bradyrhizobium sp. USDA 4518]
MHRTDEDLEDVARRFLRKIGLEHQVKPDMMTIISKLKHVDPSFKYRRVADRDMPDAEARWSSDATEISLRESVFIGMQKAEPRARMTVSHELSHYLLKHEGHLNRSTVKTVVEISARRIAHQESEARRLAPIILAPEYLVPEGASVEDIMTMFGLSHEAAVIRKDEIEAVRRRRRGEKRPLPQSIIDYLKEAKRRGHPVRTDLGEET